MSTPPVRFSQLRWLHNAAGFVGVLGASLAILLGLFGYVDSAAVWLVLAGIFGLVVIVLLVTIMPLLVKMESTFARQLNELRELKSVVSKQTADLHAIADNTRISDAAKSLAHRDQEVDALRSAIQEEIRQKNWDAALSLVEEVEGRFGFKQEAEVLREELDDARRDAIQAKLADAIDLIQQHFGTYQWAKAESEIDRLAKALPGDAKIAALRDRMMLLREKHKQDLKAEWDEAVRRSDTDHAIDVLKELDQYLSTAEAHALQSSARHVFKEKLIQLGVQFRFAVVEKRWQDALTIGQELITDFPNARMASEVREALPTLRERAGESAESATTEPTGQPTGT